jgi:DNA-binding LytR/AlgR family response regulator
MPKFKTFIVEDQDAPLKALLRYLQPFPNVIDLDSLNIATSFKEAQRIILNGSSFELSILDQKLEAGKTCFDLITKENKKAFGIIALNSQDKTSQKHFERISLLGEYLVLRKPYNEDDITSFIERLQYFKQREDTAAESDRPLLIKEKNRQFSIDQDRIIYIEVNNNLSTIFYTEGSKTKSCNVVKQLNHYENILNKKFFVRISDKHLLNMRFFSELSYREILLSVKVNDKDKRLPLPDKNRATFISWFAK